MEAYKDVNLGCIYIHSQTLNTVRASDGNDLGPGQSVRRIKVPALSECRIGI